MRSRKRQGFTVIELLVVIALITFLAAIIAVVTLGRLAQARDTERKSELDTVKKALEAAKSECKNNDWYPDNSSIWSAPLIRYRNLSTYLTDPDLQHLQTAPIDPKNDGIYYYGYSVKITNPNRQSSVCPSETPGSFIYGSKDYRLIATMEKTDDPAIAESQAKCPYSNEFWLLPIYTSQLYVVCPD